MEKLNKNILEVSNGDLKTRIQEDYEVEFHEICHNFNYMLDHIENLMKQLEKEGMLVVEMDEQKTMLIKLL